MPVNKNKSLLQTIKCLRIVLIKNKQTSILILFAVLSIAILIPLTISCNMRPVSRASTQTNDNKQTTKNIDQTKEQIVTPLAEAETKANDTIDGENTITPSMMPDTYEKPSYSIGTTKNITVHIGEYVGPFSASTSDGTVVSWETPFEKDSYSGVYGYTNDSTAISGSSSMEYYIRAESSATPGTHYLYLTAKKMDSYHPQMSSTRLTVTVEPIGLEPYVKISSPYTTYTVTRGSSIQIPYTIDRSYGYTDIVSVTAMIIGAESNENISDIKTSTVSTSENGGYIIFDASDLPGPNNIRIAIMNSPADFNSSSGPISIQVINP